MIASEPSGDSPIPVDTMALADRVRGVVSILLNTCTVSVRLKSEIMHKLSSEFYVWVSVHHKLIYMKEPT